MKRALTWIVLGAVLILAAVAVVGQWDDLRPRVEGMAPGDVLLSFVSGLAAIGCAVPSWRAVLAEVGTRLPLRPATGVFLAGQLGKFVPGSVWVVLAQAQLAARYGVSRVRSATAGLLSMGVSLATAGAVGAALLPLASAQARDRYGWVALLALVALVGLTPPVLTPAVAWGLHLLKRAPLDRPLSWRGMGESVSWAVLGWLFYGLHLWFLVRAVPGHHGDGLLGRSIGAFALAWAVGFLVVLAPAGAGAREAALIVFLHPVLPAGGPLAVALASRLVLTVGDVLLGLPAFLVARRVADSQTEQS